MTRPLRCMRCLAGLIRKRSLLHGQVPSQKLMTRRCKFKHTNEIKLLKTYSFRYTTKGRTGCGPVGPVVQTGQLAAHTFTQLPWCLVQVGNGIELDTVGRQFESYRWRPCGVTVPNSRGNTAAANLRLYHAVGRQFESYSYSRLRLHRWRPCHGGMTWDSVPEHGGIKAAANLRLLYAGCWCDLRLFCSRTILVFKTTAKTRHS